MMANALNNVPFAVSAEVKIMDTKRDTSIDTLRAIAFLCLVAAHIQPPMWVAQLRNFDVPMMVFLSGVSFHLSAGKNNSYFQYVWKRFVRIIIPTWIFLIIHNYVIIHGNIIDALSRFTLMTSWYVWIMRVFFVIALFAPIILSISRRKYFLLTLFIALIINEIASRIVVGPFGGNGNDIRVILMMNLPYMLIFSFGLIIHRLPNKLTFVIGVFSLGIYISLALYYYRCGVLISTDEQKYPPQCYYIAYSLIWIVALWLLRKYIVKVFEVLCMQPIMLFIGRHTMWIYFYHIIMLNHIYGIEVTFFRFILVIFVATLTTYVQHKLIVRLSPYLSSTQNKTIRTIFDG